MVRVLSDVDIFHSVPPAALAVLAGQGHRRTFSAGHKLIRQGDAAAALHVILAGRVCIDRPHPSLKEPLILEELGPGEVVGEAGVLDGEAHRDNVTAVEDTETIELSARALALTILQFPEVLTDLLRSLSRRLRSADDLTAQLPGLSAS